MTEDEQLSEAAFETVDRRVTLDALFVHHSFMGAKVLTRINYARNACGIHCSLWAECVHVNKNSTFYLENAFHLSLMKERQK